MADDDPTRKLIRQVLGAVSEFEKSVLVAKLRAARDRIRRSAGRCEGRKPYGKDEQEQVAVARIRELRRKRPNGKATSYAAIAAILNTEGVPTRYGRPWKHGTVQAILARTRP